MNHSAPKAVALPLAPRTMIFSSTVPKSCHFCAHVIGGGVMESANIIIPYVETHVHKYAWTPCGKVAELANNAALVGAIPLLSEEIP